MAYGRSSIDRIPTLHPLLQSQLARAGLSRSTPPSAEVWARLVDVISETYAEGDDERPTLLDEARAQLARSEASYRTLFDSSPIAMLLFDAAPFRFLEVNDTALRLYGYSRDELLAMSMTELEPPDESSLMVRSVEVAMPGTTYEGVQALEIRRLRPAARIVYMSGYSQHVTMKGASLAEDDHFLAKPFTPQGLVALVHAVLARERARTAGAA